MSSIFSRLANQVGQNYLTALGQASPLIKFGTDLINQKLTSSVSAGDRALFGGLSENNWRAMADEFMSIDRAKANLYHVNVTNLQTGTAPALNMFIVDYGVSPFTVRGESVAVGAGSFDRVDGVEAVQLRLTTMDDVGGSVKTWFKTLKRAMAPGDGTVGLPLSYLVRITITHAFISAKSENAGRAFVETYVVRPQNIEYEGSRRQDGMQELQLSFVQFDTFTNLV
ncbi:hypothetical protein [Pseudomonas oryzihabitans]|uniref:hypothetical protein n=1 Tax=Pseudomonas oryzihabitans TaxID=47885 RepID=UPI0028B25ACF|nr:hypothetical protein [Pseudomonas oryzihabitans]